MKGGGFSNCGAQVAAVDCCHGGRQEHEQEQPGQELAAAAKVMDGVTSSNASN